MGPNAPAQPEERPVTDAAEGAPSNVRPASRFGPPEAGRVAPPPVLPPIAAKADDLEAIKKAVDDAAAISGALWFSYLFVLFYFAIAAGAVTHADLFFENAVKLPFLNIELPLLAFFFLAPILFIVVHAYTLVHLVMLTDKAKRYHRALHTQIGDADAAVRDGLRWLLDGGDLSRRVAGRPLAGLAPLPGKRRSGTRVPP